MARERIQSTATTRTRRHSGGLLHQDEISNERSYIDTIRNINDDEFNYGILILGSLYGITLSLLANVLEFFLRELFGDKGFAVFITLLFVIGSFAIIKGLEGVSRGRAKHWKLLESFQEEVKRTKA